MKKVLLAEDDPFLIDIYSTKLKELGAEIDVAITGNECLDKLKEQKFDLLILDIILPGIDGWEILKNINKKRGGVFKNLKILVLSNLGDKKDIERGLQLGADKYLIKAHHTPSEVVKVSQELLQ